ncbi:MULTISPECIES: CamS family sex pheromone protein [Pediococcus]|uniref:CamS family sex pheromone protein n=1 Tax=Pediococcus TaxID=1253 RepID=UPI00070AC194|nr:MULTISPECIES: CamS family sex pheromone protein [Pediococcus]MCT3026940.1 CamS family sex pheromone protein [Pediococcus parvulus]MCT3029588.1 CamS family sex pheromone protein [Pediococcus parvulus]MCT3030924.1 CamS family sex pheromone protein [Pediococcus parvulus]GEL88976.1 CamS family sex pheromone protein [Pediococcus parvulus]GHC03256.1 CamS family sex pheromone protein [Pediococcus parvulus]
MNLKKSLLGIAVVFSAVVLASCGSSSNKSSSSSSSSKTTTSSKSGSYQVTGQTNDSEYAGVIKNGKYLTSKSRGVTANQDSNLMNLKSFETGLQDISKTQFSTTKYVFQEGQYLSKSTVENWLGRKTKSNTTGLNPASNGSTEPTKRNPIYLQSIEEQDYMQKSGSKLKLSGVTIGLAMNSVDYYRKTTYGAQYETDISDATLEKEGKAMAKEVLARLRKRAALKNVPIVIALYKQASNDSLIGGHYVTYSVSNGDSIKKWKALDIQNVVFPLKTGETAPNTNDADAFSNFKSEVESFFPNLSGVTAQAQYKNGSLQGMNVSITTQFYSETEIKSFTQFLADQAEKYLPSGVKTDITVSSTTDGVQSFLSRKSSGKSFTTHVFGSY